MVRNFIWKGNNDSRHAMHLVKWDITSQPRRKGGLEIRRARLCNTTMLGKLVCEIQNQPNNLWVQLIRHKYLQEDLILKPNLMKNGFVV